MSASAARGTQQVYSRLKRFEAQTRAHEPETTAMKGKLPPPLLFVPVQRPEVRPQKLATTPMTTLRATTSEIPQQQRRMRLEQLLAALRKTTEASATGATPL